MDSTVNSDTEILTPSGSNDENEPSRFNPDSRLYRYTGLFLMCLIGFGTNFQFFQHAVVSSLKPLFQVPTFVTTAQGLCKTMSRAI